MRSDELHKFSDGTLQSVRDTLYDMANNLRSQNQRDIPRNIPLVRIEVLRYEEKRSKVRKGKIATKTELTLEQTQQGVSDEALVSIKGVEELKRKVKIKDEKKEALLTLRQKPVLNLKNFKKDDYTSSQDKERYEHVDPEVTRSQEGKRLQDDEKR
ncbi:hypothetical protein Tco_0853132 [Tanacetum coccineum]